MKKVYGPIQKQAAAAASAAQAALEANQISRAQISAAGLHDSASR
jgi:hypothetical protein